MEKVLTWIVRYDMAGFTNSLNKFLGELGHYKLFDVHYEIDERDINNRRYSALILHQKLD